MATAHLLHYRDNISPDTLKLVLAALAFTILAELSFTLYLSVYGHANLIGHYFKLLSFYCLYMALIRSGLINPTRFLFHNLEEKSKLFQDLYDNAPLPYQSLDENGHLIEVNTAWLDTMGYERKEVIGRSFNDFLDAKDQDHFKENSPWFKDLDEILGIEFDLLKKNGSFITVKFDGKISYDEQGNFNQTHCIFQNISFQKKMENALIESENRFRGIFNNSPIFIVYLDKDLQSIELNSRMERLIGCRSRDVKGRHCYEVWGQYANDNTKKDREKICDACKTKLALKDGKTHTFERQAGDRYIQVFTSPVKDAQGHIIGVLECGADITQRKAAEKDLLAIMKELREANAELAQFNYVVAHDLKAPIRAMSNYSAFLQQDLASLVSGEAKKYLARLGQTAVETSQLVDELLFLSKISNQKPELIEIDLTDFLEKLVKSMSLSSDIEISLGKDWPRIMSDPFLLHQIFENLIDNAQKYNIARNKKIEISWLPGEDGINTFFVRDNGIGIRPEFHEQIFGLFERLHSASEYKGTGVGLAIVKKAVIKLGGRIRLESTKDKGSSFYVLLPVEMIGESR